jgi:hypothetical protein
VREFLLVVPDLMLASGAARTDAGAPGLRLRFGPATPLRGGWRSWLARRLARPELDAASRAAVVAAAALPGPVPLPSMAGDGAWWLATPLHLVAGLDTLHLPRDGILALSPAERAELAADFSAALGGAGVSLHAVDGDALLLHAPDPGEVETREPAACLGADLVRAQPSGPGAAALRRLMAEIEMWLHDHPVNRRRERAGRRAVRSLWLWGGEAREPVARVGAAAAGATDGASSRATDAVSGLRRIHSRDAWVRAAARLAAVELAPEGELPSSDDFGAPGTLLATAGLCEAEAPEFDEFEQRHLRPAFVALAAGRLDRIGLLSADRCVTATAADRYRVWRPRRPWLTALGEQG